MNIKRIKLADVKPAAYNPRRQLKPGEKEYEALKASISRWSLVEPLVVNLRTGNLVGGHQRYNVLLDLGHTEAEAAVVDLDEKQEKLLNVALNRIEGQWDYENCKTCSRNSAQRTSSQPATPTGSSRPFRRRGRRPHRPLPR